MVKTSIDERRHAIRAKRILSIEFRLAKGIRKNADTSWYLSTTKDMSVGGVAFYTDVEYQVGDILETHVVMSGILDIFRGFCKVVRVYKTKGAAHYLIAVKLVDKSLKERATKGFITTKRRAKKYIN